MRIKERVSKANPESGKILDGFSGHRRITSKGQVTIPNVIRKRYNITTHTKLEFVSQPEGIMVRPVVDEGDFSDLAGSASKHWTVDEMLKRLEKLRTEYA